MHYTADEVRELEFPNSPMGRRGYAKNEVDAFVDRIAKTLDDEDDLTAAEVHHVHFGRPPIGKRGYDEREVDEFLDKAEEDLMNRAGTTRDAHQVPSARDDEQQVNTEPGSFAGGTAWQ